MFYHSGEYKGLGNTSRERNTRRILIPEIWSGHFPVRFGCPDDCATLQLTESGCATRAREIIQWLALTCASKEAFNGCPWPADNLSNKSDIPEAVEKSDDHAFFNIGHFCSGGLWSSLFFFWFISGSVHHWKFRIIKIEDDGLGSGTGSRYYRAVNRGGYGRDPLARSICWGGIWRGCLVSDHEHFWRGTVGICLALSIKLLYFFII